MSRGLERVCMQTKFGESENSVGSRLLYFGGSGESEHSIGSRLPLLCYKTRVMIVHVLS